jgi:uncharacterized membrane protein
MGVLLGVIYRQRLFSLLGLALIAISLVLGTFAPRPASLSVLVAGGLLMIVQIPVAVILGRRGDLPAAPRPGGY